MKICGVFTRWDQMFSSKEKLTESDKKVLVWGLTELSKFTSKKRTDQAEELMKSWKQLGKDIVECQLKLQELRQKWDGKVEHAEKLNTCLAVAGGILIAVGIIGLVVAAWYAAPAIIAAGGAAIKTASAAGVGVMATAKAGLVGGYAAIPTGVGYVSCAAVGFSMAGAGAIGYGEKNLYAHKGIKNKIEEVEKQLECYKEPTLMMQDWKEVIRLLEIPLGNIGLGGDDYKSTIDGWDRINEHEKELLKTAADTFKSFRDQSLDALNKMKSIQQKLQ